MRLEHAQPEAAKGWYLGPWNSSLGISIGFASKGIDEPHGHRVTNEIYLVARGTAELRVEQQTFALGAGDLLVIEPGEAHTFVASSPDYFHFVIHTPGMVGEQAKADKSAVPPDRLAGPS